MNESLFCPTAAAHIRGNCEAPRLCGKVRFYQKTNCVLVEAFISGLPQSESGFFGFHIHEGDSCKGEGFSETAGHFNPIKVPHPSHAGDLPPLMLCGGGACLSVTTDRFTVKEIIGRTVVIHSMPDDFHTQPSGNAGTKIGCGVICRV